MTTWKSRDLSRIGCQNFGSKEGDKGRKHDAVSEPQI